MSGRLVLALDCATEYLAVALVDEGGQVSARSAALVGRDHAARLPLEFEDLLRRAGRPRAAIARIQVGVGPGSYTGTRVAVAAAKGLARALGVPLAGVSSFVGLAAGVLEPGATAAVTLDARRGNVYAQVCRREATSNASAASERVAARVVTLSAALKLPAAEVAARFGMPVRASQAPDAAALAASSQALPAEVVYL